MKGSLIVKILFFFLGLLLFIYPFLLQADEIEVSIQDIDSSQIVEAPKQLTKEEINDLFGEDPYLGQTSYLQSPDGFSQREELK